MLNTFLTIIGADRLALQNLQRALEFGWDKESLLVQIGQAQIRLRQFDQAQDTFERILRDYPRNLEAPSELSFLAESRGDLVTAEAMLRRALEIAPDDSSIRNNHLRIKMALQKSTTNRTPGEVQ
jgi:Flp pilus assembly protein TadD